MEGISTLLSSLLNAIINGIVDTIVSESSAVGELIHQIMNSFEALLNNVVSYEIIQGFAQMVSTLIFDVLNNCIQALGYVNKNA